MTQSSPTLQNMAIFLLDVVGQGRVHAGDDDVGRDAHALQFLDRMLGGLGLELAGAGDVRHEGDVDKAAVAPARLHRDLADRLDEGLAFDVADGAADLGDDDVRAALLADAVDEGLDLARDVRDDLHRLAEIFAVALLVEHVPVHFARREVGELVQVFVDEALVVAQVEVGLGAVVGDEHFAVLVRAHRARIDVDVRIQLLRGDFIAARLQEPAQARRRDALAEPGHDAARDEYVLHAAPPRQVRPPFPQAPARRRGKVFRFPPAGGTKFFGSRPQAGQSFSVPARRRAVQSSISPVNTSTASPVM